MVWKLGKLARAGGAGARRRWWAVIGMALLVTFLVLGPMAYWFGCANRYVVFLYNHDMGPRVPDTRPFSPVTRSRLWMTGLVVSGAVMVAISLVYGVLGRFVDGYRPPAWRRVWLAAAVPVAVGIPWITMTLNSPTLPPQLAALVTGVTLLGLVLALQPGALAAHQPLDLILLAGDGAGLALWLVTLPGLAYMPYWLTTGGRHWLLLLSVPLVVGLAILGSLTILRRLLPRTSPPLRALVVSGLCVAYLLLPLVHHVLGTDGLFYISDMDNFFSRNPLVQVLTWALTTGLAWAVSRLRSQG